MWHVFEIEPNDDLERRLYYYPFIIWKSCTLNTDADIQLVESNYRCKVKAVWECEDGDDAEAWISYLKRLRNENK